MQEFIKDADTWYEAYEKLENTDEQHDFLLETLTYDMSDEFVGGTDWTGQVIELLGDIIDKNNDYEKGLLFLKKYRELKPELLNKDFHYYESYIVDYELFHDNPKDIQEVVDYYYEDPDGDIDMALVFHAKIEYWQLVDAAYRIAKKNYEPVSKNPDYLGNAALDYALTVYSKGLQDAYADYLKTGELNLEKAREEGLACEMTEAAYDFFEESVKTPFSTDALKPVFEENQTDFCWQLRMYFYQYMHEKGMSFGLAGIIWQDLVKFWFRGGKPQKTNDLDVFFKMTYHAYDKHLSGKKFIFMLRTNEVMASLWGAVFGYDFLYSKGLISEAVYKQTIVHLETFKFVMIRGFHQVIWKGAYIHKVWAKPDGVPQAVHDAERQLFEASYNKAANFPTFKSENSEAFEHIPQHTIPGEKKKPKAPKQRRARSGRKKKKKRRK